MEVREVYASADGRFFSYVTKTGLTLVEQGPRPSGNLTGLSLAFKEDRIVQGWHEDHL